LPIVNILRLRFPHAKIAWLASPEMIDFLNSYNIADRLIVAKPSWYKKFCEIKMLRKKLQSFAPDLCLDLQGDLSGRLSSKLSGSDVRISIKAKRGHFLSQSKKPAQVENQLEKHLKMLEALDVVGASIDYDLPEIPLERREVGWVMRDLGLESTPFAMFSLGVQSNLRPWEIDRYVLVAEHLWHTHHLRTVAAWQNKQDKKVAEKIVAEAGGMVALTPVLSAIQLTALARRTSVFVGTDNDFLHIAAAVGAPCIGVFCEENARRDAPLCNNFQAIKAAPCEPRWKRRGVKVGASPVRIDNYTYDVIEVCNACEDILQPEFFHKPLPAVPPAQPEFPVGVPNGQLVEV